MKGAHNYNRQFLLWKLSIMQIYFSRGSLGRRFRKWDHYIIHLYIIFSHFSLITCKMSRLNKNKRHHSIENFFLQECSALLGASIFLQIVLLAQLYNSGRSWLDFDVLEEALDTMRWQFGFCCWQLISCLSVGSNDL